MRTRETPNMDTFHAVYVALNNCFWEFFFLLKGGDSELCASFKAAFDNESPIKIKSDQSMTLADGEKNVWKLFIWLKDSNLFG